MPAGELRLPGSLQGRYGCVRTWPGGMLKTVHNDRLATLPFFLLMTSVFAVYVGYGIVLPVLPFLLENLLQNTARFSVAWHTGMIAGIYMLAVFVCAPLWGRVSDRIGRRPGGALTLMLGSIALSAMAEDTELHQVIDGVAVYIGVLPAEMIR